ncbi:aminopeptidase P family protein [Candidatus Microgenomates bacterium]|nr:aminopeptidase P family protein [Candidatus Microgenomates bacterium]
MNIRKMQEFHGTRDFIIVHATMSAMFERRIKILKQHLKREKLDGVLISSVPNITYLTGYSNFFKEERDGYLLITKDRNYILTHSIYSKAINISNFKVVEISRREPPAKVMQKILKNNDAYIGIEEHDLRVYEYKKLVFVFKNLKNFDLKIKRSIKDKDEIELISKACQIGDKVFKKAVTKIKLGISEKKLAFAIDNVIKKLGYEPSFKIIIAFGKNAAYPHHESGKDRLRKNQFVLMDFGVKFENYCSDMTRTVFFGKPNKKQIKMYETVLRAQQKSVDSINESIKKGKKILARDIDNVAREYIESKGFPTIPHSLGHGIGLEVHEHPSLSSKSKDFLKEGMVFSIEPGIYIPGFGSPRSTRLATKRTRVEAGGVRIEDLYLFTNKGLKQITTSPKSLIEL